MDIKAQIVKLDNVGLQDDEIVFYCNDFYELQNLIENPITYMKEKGKLWEDEDWTLLSPVTAIINPTPKLNEGTRFFAFSPIPLWQSFASLGVFGLDENDRSESTKGGFIAQFAKNTHTLLITYVRPSTDNIRPFSPKLKFTVPNTVKINDDYATVHFDFEAADKSAMTVDQMRAQYVVDHLADPDAHTWGRLDPHPLVSQASEVLEPHQRFDVRKGEPSRTDIKFRQIKSADVSMIVEGLCVAERVVVCTLSGAVWDGECWRLNGDVVKNYVSP